MLSHLYGPDTYRRQRFLKEKILAPYSKKYPDGAVGYFDLAEGWALDLLRQSAAAGLFAKTLLAVVYNPADGEKEAAKFLKELMENQHFSAIVISDKKLTKDFSFLYDGKEKEFPLLSGEAFVKFLEEETKRIGVNVTKENLREIALLHEGDSWFAITEICRIADGGNIEKRGVDYDFVSTISSLTADQLGRRLRSLFLLLENEDAAKVFNMAGGWAKGGNKIRMADYDVAVKSGKLEFADALADYVL
jgi:hypothetical protein